jgi:hypothetical protein
VHLHDGDDSYDIPDTAKVEHVVYKKEHQKSSHVEPGNEITQRLRYDVCEFIREILNTSNQSQTVIYSMVKEKFGYKSKDRLLYWPQTDTVDSDFYKLMNRKIKHFIKYYKKEKGTGASSVNRADLPVDERRKITDLFANNPPADPKTTDLDKRKAYFVDPNEEKSWTISTGKNQFKFFGCLIHPALLARFINSDSDFLGLDQTCGSNKDEIKSKFCISIFMNIYFK